MNNNVTSVIFCYYTALISIESQFELSSLIFGYHGEKPFSNVPDRLGRFSQWKSRHELVEVGRE